MIPERSSFILNRVPRSFAISASLVKVTGKSLIGTVIYTPPLSLSLSFISRVSSGKVVLPKFFWFWFWAEQQVAGRKHVLLYCDFYQFSSCSPWENSRHFKTPLLVSPRNDVWATFAEISYWWPTASQDISLAEKRDLTIIQHQSGSTDPERSLA